MRYYLRVLSRAFSDGAVWGRDQVIGLLLALAILAIQYQAGLIVSYASWKSVLLPYGVLLAGFVILHLVRAPWKLDQESRATVSAERIAKEKAEAELNAGATIRGRCHIWVDRVERCITFDDWGCSNHGREACQISSVVLANSSGVLELFELDDDQVTTVNPREQFRPKRQLRRCVSEERMADLVSGVEVRLRDSVGTMYPLTTVLEFSSVVGIE